MATYYIVRHGTTEWVDQQILHGITDVPLNEKGLQQARKTAQALKSIKADHIFCSSLIRAMQTAEIIGKEIGVEPEALEGLKEMNFGWMEGKKTRDDIHKEIHPLVHYFDHYWLSFIRSISGESRRRFSARVLQAWHYIQEQTRGENSIIVSHSGILNVILMELLGNHPPKGQTYFASHPCGITEMTTDSQGKPHLVRLDNFAHLKEWYPNDH